MQYVINRLCSTCVWRSSTNVYIRNLINQNINQNQIPRDKRCRTPALTCYPVGLYHIIFSPASQLSSSITSIYAALRICKAGFILLYVHVRILHVGSIAAPTFNYDCIRTCSQPLVQDTYIPRIQCNAPIHTCLHTAKTR